MQKNNGRIQKKRAILITENEEPLFRYDVNLNGRNFIEYDVFNALSDMDNAGIINMKKVFNMMKVRYGLTLTDKVNAIVTETIGKSDEWKIVPNEA